MPTAVYTGVGADGPEHAVTLVATSGDGLRTWTQEPAAVAVPDPQEGVREVRDPFVFTHDGHRWAVQGAGHPQGRGRLLLWRCDDLRAWEPAGELLTSDDPVAARWAPANTWECPNLVPFGDRWLLVVSLWHWRDGSHALDGVSWLLGDLEPSGGACGSSPPTAGSSTAAPPSTRRNCSPPTTAGSWCGGGPARTSETRPTSRPPGGPAC